MWSLEIAGRFDLNRHFLVLSECDKSVVVEGYFFLSNGYVCENDGHFQGSHTVHIFTFSL